MLLSISYNGLYSTSISTLKLLFIRTGFRPISCETIWSSVKHIIGKVIAFTFFYQMNSVMKTCHSVMLGNIISTRNSYACIIWAFIVTALVFNILITVAATEGIETNNITEYSVSIFKKVIFNFTVPRLCPQIQARSTRSNLTLLNSVKSAKSNLFIIFSVMCMELYSCSHVNFMAYNCIFHSAIPYKLAVPIGKFRIVI